MPFFRCLIRGEGFPGGLIGEAGMVGFYATRFVEAADPHAAGKIAFGLLREEPTLQSSSERPKEAKVFFQEITEVSADDAAQARGGAGITFFKGT